jgi:hypothetical protein
LNLRIGPKIDADFRADAVEQFQEKCAAVFRPELHRNRLLERSAIL